MTPAEKWPKILRHSEDWSELEVEIEQNLQQAFRYRKHDCLRAQTEPHLVLTPKITPPEAWTEIGVGVLGSPCPPTSLFVRFDEPRPDGMIGGAKTELVTGVVVWEYRLFLE